MSPYHPQKYIESYQNPTIKNILELQEKSRARKKQGLLVIEGLKEVLLAIKSKYQISQIFICEDFVHLIDEHFDDAINICVLSNKVYQKIAYRQSTEGVIAIAQSKEHSLEHLSIKSDALIVVIESIEKPGNIGGVLRTVDALGADALIICNPHTDIYNPNVIRASLGSIFSTSIAIGSSNDVITYLQNKNINIYTTLLDTDSTPYYNIDYTHASAIVMGTEATGLSEIWGHKNLTNIHIPMYGNMDSMNISVATAIITAEAVKQRKLV